MVDIATGWPSMKTTDEQFFFKELGLRLANARKARHFTQQQVADQLGIAQQTVAHYEAGRMRVPAFTLSPLAQMYGMTVDELLGHEMKSSGGKRGPTPKLQKQFERISLLPRLKQQVVMDMLEGVLAQASH
jgi:transcriptional regulator with XRE-family HTH domain